MDIEKLKNEIALKHGYQDGILGNAWDFAMQLTHRTKRQIALYEELIAALAEPSSVPQANELLPLVSVSESDIEDMFPYEDIETARPTRPENRIRAYNSRQADRREGAKRLLEKLHSR